MCDDAPARSALNHRGAHVRTVREHQVHEIRRFGERVRINLRRGDDRITVRADPLGVERGDAILVVGIEPERLHGDLARHARLGLVSAADDQELMAERRGDLKIVSRLRRAVGNAVGVGPEPVHVDGFAASIPDLQTRPRRRLRPRRAGDQYTGERKHEPETTSV